MNVVLITDIPPCKNFTAGLVTNILCDFLLEDGNRVACFSVKNKYVDAIIPQDKQEQMIFQSVEKPRENWGTSNFKKYASLAGNSFVTYTLLPDIAKKAMKFIEDNQADVVWFIVQGQVMINLAQLLMKMVKQPKLVQIWDPPHWWLSENKVDSITQRAVLKNYGRVIHEADCCITASWAMADFYSNLYGATCVPVILGFDPEKPARTRQEDDTFIIALSGQQYSSDEILALRRTLCNMSWQYAGKKITLRLYGRDCQMAFFSEERVEMRGWLGQEQLINELAHEVDLLYCPYWFAPAFEQPCRYSFPSKLSTYLKCGVPVLFHGPEYASPRIFLEKHNGGYICGSLDESIIQQILQSIIEAPNREDVADQGYNAFLQHLTLYEMKKNFVYAFSKCNLDKEEGAH